MYSKVEILRKQNLFIQVSINAFPNSNCPFARLIKKRGWLCQCSITVEIRHFGLQSSHNDFQISKSSSEGRTPVCSVTRCGLGMVKEVGSRTHLPQKEKKRVLVLKVWLNCPGTLWVVPKTVSSRLSVSGHLDVGSGCHVFGSSGKEDVAVTGVLLQEKAKQYEILIKSYNVRASWPKPRTL